MADYPRVRLISEQLADGDRAGNVIDLSQATWQSHPPDPLAVLRQGWDDPEALAEAARHQLSQHGQDCMLRGIGLAVLALRAEIRDGRAES